MYLKVLSDKKMHFPLSLENGFSSVLSLWMHIKLWCCTNKTKTNSLICLTWQQVSIWRIACFAPCRGKSIAKDPFPSLCVCLMAGRINCTKLARLGCALVQKNLKNEIMGQCTGMAFRFAVSFQMWQIVAMHFCHTIKHLELCVYNCGDVGCFVCNFDVKSCKYM